jgi:hypothetical protein
MLLPGRPILSDHSAKVVYRRCPAQVREAGLQASQPVGKEARVGWSVGIEPADAAEDVEAGPYGVRVSAYCVRVSITYARVSCSLR